MRNSKSPFQSGVFLLRASTWNDPHGVAHRKNIIEMTYRDFLRIIFCGYVLRCKCAACPSRKHSGYIPTQHSPKNRLYKRPMSGFADPGIDTRESFLVVVGNHHLPCVLFLPKTVYSGCSQEKLQRQRRHEQYALRNHMCPQRKRTISWCGMRLDTDKFACQKRSGSEQRRR